MFTGRAAADVMSAITEANFACKLKKKKLKVNTKPFQKSGDPLMLFLNCYAKTSDFVVIGFCFLLERSKGSG